jgi:hypothetical protein
VIFEFVQKKRAPGDEAGGSCMLTLELSGNFRS